MDAGQLQRLKSALNRMNGQLEPATPSGYGAPFLPTTPLFKKKPEIQENENYVAHTFSKWPTMKDVR
jgi:hypothetical protein